MGHPGIVLEVEERGDLARHLLRLAQEPLVADRSHATQMDGSLWRWTRSATYFRQWRTYDTVFTTCSGSVRTIPLIEATTARGSREEDEEAGVGVGAGHRREEVDDPRLLEAQPGAFGRVTHVANEREPVVEHIAVRRARQPVEVGREVRRFVLAPSDRLGNEHGGIILERQREIGAEHGIELPRFGTEK